MTPGLTYLEIVSATLTGARRIMWPTLGHAALFVVSIAVLFWSAIALPERSLGSVSFAALTAATLFAYCVFSAAMHRALVPSSGGLFAAAWKLLLAWMLILVVAAIGATMIVLFFSLIGSSLGVVSGESGQDITDMTAQMRAGGTFYPLFALFMATLVGVFWFAVRMMLFAAATVSRGAVHVFRSWAWTKGHFFVLAAGMATFVILPVIALSYAAGAATTFVPQGIGEPAAAGLSAGLTAIALTPAAWLGHGFAAHALSALAPRE